MSKFRLLVLLFYTVSIPIYAFLPALQNLIFHLLKKSVAGPRNQLRTASWTA